MVPPGVLRAACPNQHHPPRATAATRATSRPTPRARPTRELTRARPQERSRRTLSKKSKRGDTLAALRDARSKGSALDRLELKEEEDVYEQVSEDQYAELVRQRRQGEDFVVDDDGLGYFDDGEEHLGEEDVDPAELGRGQVTAKRTTAHGADAVKKAKKLKEARSAADGDEPAQGNKMFQYLGAPGAQPKKKPPPSRAAAAALDGFDSLIDGIGGAAPARTPRAAPSFGAGLGAGLGGLARGAPPSRRAAAPSALDRAQLPVSGGRSLAAPRARLSYSQAAPLAPAWGGEVSFDSAPADDMAMDGVLFAQPEDDDAPMPPAEEEAPKPKSSRFSKHAAKAAGPSEATLKALAGPAVVKEEVKAEVAKPEDDDEDAVKQPERMTYGDEDESAPAADPSYGTGASVVGGSTVDEAKYLRKDDDGDHCWMYWLDVVEQSGSIYLVGKVKLEGEDAYASACVVVRDVERSFFVLPRVDPESGERYPMAKVWAETRAELVPRCVPKQAPFKCKGVKRGYCFGDGSVPRDDATEYLKVKYLSKFRPPPRGLCDRGGRVIEKILGAGATPLELFLVKRKLMGPCWIRVDKPKAHSPKVSWCAVEVEVASPKAITLARDCPYAAPPLVCTTISLKTVVNPKTHQHEIVAVSALTHRGVGIDGATPDGGRGEDERLFAPSPGASHKAGSRRWTCVGARPLGAEIAAATKGAARFPRDLATDLKVAEKHGFLSDKGTVTLAPNERALVSCLLSRLQQDDPDVLVGHNILGFELDVLLGRALHLKLGNAWSKVGRLKRNKPPSRWKAASGRDTFHASATCGRLICDTYLAAREHVRGATTYALAALAATQLGVRGRRALEPQDVAHLLGSTKEHVAGLLRHSAEDCRLVERLMLRLQIMPLSKQLTAISGNLLARTLKGHRAERIEYLLLHEFHRIKYIAPEKQRYDEDSDDDSNGKGKGKKRDRHAGRAKAAYQGGLVLEPKKGFYDSHVLLLDFASLYPSIIQEYDICFTTIDWSKYALPEKLEDAPAAKRRAVEDGDDDAGDDEDDDDAAPELPPLPDRAGGATGGGVLPKVLKALIDRRREVKQLIKKEKNPKTLETYNIRQMALKLTANSMYGCLGFSHSRFFAKPLAALVTSLGRDTLQATADVAEKELGLEVIYGDTDSIMINTRTDDLAVVKDLGAKVKKAVNKRYRLLELELDGIFKAMLLLKKKKYAALVVNEDPKTGQLSYKKETKGLDLVRRDWCPLSKATGTAILDHLLSGEGSEAIVSAVNAVLEDVGQRARSGDVDVADYVITRGLNKPVEKYPDSKSQPHLRVAKAMLKEGRAVNVGDHIPYVICMGSDKNVADRSYHPDAVATVTKIDEENRPPPSAKEAEAPPVVTPGSSEKPSLEKPKVDVEWYLTQQILPPIARLCEPIAGMSRASIADKLGLDARKFAAAMARSQSALDEANANMRSFTPASLQSDEERFADCQPLVVECGSCKLRWPLPLEQRGARARLEAARDAATPAKAADCKALSCGHCRAKLLGYKNAASCFSRVSVALQMATRASLKDYYDGWMVCDDSACGARTRQLSCAGVRCLSRGCKGKLVPEANEKRIYTQLQYYAALFDDDRLACPPKSDEREVAKFLMKQVADDIQASAYNFVRPSIFNVFAKDFAKYH